MPAFELSNKGMKDWAVGEGAGAGNGLSKCFFRPFGPQFGPKVRGGALAPRAPPLDLPLVYLGERRYRGQTSLISKETQRHSNTSHTSTDPNSEWLGNHASVTRR